MKVQTVRNKNKRNTIRFKILKTPHQWRSGFGNTAQRWLSPGKKENEKKRIKREMRKEDEREDINVRYMNLSYG